MTSSSGWFQGAGVSTFDSTRKKTLPGWPPRQLPLNKLSQSVRPKLPPSERCVVPKVTQNPGIVFSLSTGINY